MKKKVIKTCVLIPLFLLGLSCPEVMADWEVRILTYQPDQPVRDPATGETRKPPLLERKYGLGHALLHFKKISETYKKNRSADNLYADFILDDGHVNLKATEGLLDVLENMTIRKGKARASWSGRTNFAGDGLRYLDNSDKPTVVTTVTDMQLEALKTSIVRETIAEADLKYRALPALPPETGIYNCETWIDHVLRDYLGISDKKTYGFSELISETVEFNP